MNPNHCDLCERNVPVKADGLRGHLCTECTNLVAWITSNAWWSNKAMRYLMRFQ